MQTKSTEELLAIWTQNDVKQWSKDAFEAIRQTLESRGVNIPQQDVPVETQKVRNTLSKVPVEGLGAGFFAGIVGGLAMHYIGNGKMNFPIFLIIFLFILGGLKGANKVIGLIIFVVVATLINIFLGWPGSH